MDERNTDQCPLGLTLCLNLKLKQQSLSVVAYALKLLNQLRHDITNLNLFFNEFIKILRSLSMSGPGISVKMRTLVFFLNYKQHPGILNAG